MPRPIPLLILCHTDVQLLTLIRNQPFFHLAYRSQLLRRIRSVNDVRGMTPRDWLYLLPGYEQGTRDWQHVLAYWHDRKAIGLTEDHVLGRVPYVPTDVELSCAIEFAEFAMLSGAARV